MAVFTAVMVAMLALAIDLSMLFDTRAEAQRAADAAALAGASAFVALPSPGQFTVAYDRAKEFAGRNTMRGTPIDTALEVTVGVTQDTVQVTVHRASVATWFARIFGVGSVPIGARAAAEAAEAGSATCLAPVALPDIWFEASTGATGQDLNSDRVWDIIEAWDYEPGLGDMYQRYSPTATGSTGYGSSFRNGTGYTNDQGRQILIKAQSPTQSLTSGFFYPWQVGGQSGAQAYRDNWLQCNPAVVSLGVPYDIETGNMVGPTQQAINGVVAQDPTAVFDPVSGQVLNSIYPGNTSPRVLTIALFDPQQIAGIQGGGNLQLVFNNFALFFLEGLVGNGAQAPVAGRFMYFAQGNPANAGDSTGTLVKAIRLIR
jgi:hypothetical protein